MKIVTLFTIALLGITVNTQASERMNYQSVQQLAKGILKKSNFKIVDGKYSDMHHFCPKYKTLSYDEKETFWSHLIANIARYESSFNPQTSFQENNGNQSRGLLQISYPSIGTPYKKNGCSVIKTNDDLFTAEKNIKCGFAIMSTLMKQTGTISLGNQGAGRYWSTLRDPYPVYIKAIERTVVVGKKKDIVSNLKKDYSICF